MIGGAGTMSWNDGNTRGAENGNSTAGKWKWIATFAAAGIATGSLTGLVSRPVFRENAKESYKETIIRFTVMTAEVGTVSLSDGNTTASREAETGNSTKGAMAAGIATAPLQEPLYRPVNRENARSNLTEAPNARAERK